MGMESLGSEISSSMESTDSRIKDVESERPSAFEVPGFDSPEKNMNILEQRQQTDAGREKKELPHIEGRQEIEDKYYSSYNERLKQTPREDSDRGKWSGERGESDFTSNDNAVNKILEQYDKDSITYKDAIPDFSEVSEGTVEIDHMSENRVDNFRQCDEKCAEQWNEETREGKTDWTARDVKEWRQENGYSWHERNDMKSCDLIPTQVNDYFGHLGGVSECKKRDAENGGSDFDD